MLGLEQAAQLVYTRTVDAGQLAPVMLLEEVAKEAKATAEAEGQGLRLGFQYYIALDRYILRVDFSTLLSIFEHLPVRFKTSSDHC